MISHTLDAPPRSHKAAENNQGPESLQAWHLRLPEAHLRVLFVALLGHT